MFIAHLPAGYLLTDWLQKNGKTNRLMATGLLASVLPDLDLFYFYFIDHQQQLHHDYWIHRPIVWLIIAVFSFCVAFIINGSYLKIWTVFFSNILLHLLLDTVVGGIAWLYPISNQSFTGFQVPNAYQYWIFNFIFHWSFLIECAICWWAIARLKQRMN